MVERICTTDGCTKKVLGRGMCSAHYNRWRRAHFDRLCTGPDCTEAGVTRGLCSKHYQRFQTHGDTDEHPRRRAPVCSVDGCERPGNSGRGLCSMHRRRYKRNGTTETRPVGEAPPLRVGSYSRVFVGRDHPLAHSRGTVWKHRLALYEATGPGYHPCHWCGAAVCWESRWPKGSDGLCVDHLDNNRSNNDPANLVPSCGRCNVSRQPVQAGWQG